MSTEAWIEAVAKAPCTVDGGEPDRIIEVQRPGDDSHLPRGHAVYIPPTTVSGPTWTFYKREASRLVAAIEALTRVGALPMTKAAAIIDLEKRGKQSDD